MSSVPTVLEADVSARDPDLPVYGMTEREIARLDSYLRSGGSYLEFGSGGSTILALSRGVSRCVSVETDRAWLVDLAKNPRAQPFLENGALTLLYADVGPVGKYGRPIDRRNQAKWPAYWTECWSHIDPELILIDGRFRVATALEVAARITSETTVLIHDFWIRPQYHTILPWYEVLDSVDTLACLRRREDIDLDRLRLEQSHYCDSPE